MLLPISVNITLLKTFHARRDVFRGLFLQVQVDRKIVRMSKRDPRKSAAVIQREINEETGVNISKRSIARRLVEAGLHGRLARKKPLVKLSNRKRRIEFAKVHGDWTVTQGIED